MLAFQQTPDMRMKQSGVMGIPQPTEKRCNAKDAVLECTDTILLSVDMSDGTGFSNMLVAMRGLQR